MNAQRWAMTQRNNNIYYTNLECGATKMDEQKHLDRRKARTCDLLRSHVACKGDIITTILVDRVCLRSRETPERFILLYTTILFHPNL